MDRITHKNKKVLYQRIKELRKEHPYILLLLLEVILPLMILLSVLMVTAITIRIILFLFG